MYVSTSKLDTRASRTVRGSTVMDRRLLVARSAQTVHSTAQSLNSHIRSDDYSPLASMGHSVKLLFCRLLKPGELNPSLRSPHTLFLVGVSSPVQFEAPNLHSLGWPQLADVMAY